MSDVFISYSRLDRDFVQKLANTLETRSKAVWVDLEDIPPITQWLEEIYRGIDGADNFLFVISPESVASRVCGREIAYAIQNNKRLIPILRREVNSSEIRRIIEQDDWEGLSKEHWKKICEIHWISFQEYKDFDRSFDQLLKSLNRYYDYIRMHTRLLVNAREWEKNGYKNSDTLQGQNLRQAELWLDESQDKHPQPTELHKLYIHKSQTAKRNRLILTVSAVLIAIILSVFAIIQYFGRQEQEFFTQREVTARIQAEEAALVEETKSAIAQATAIAEATARVYQENIAVEEATKSAVARATAVAEATARVYQENIAEKEAANASSRELAAQIEFYLKNEDFIEAYRIAVSAYRTAQTLESQQALYAVIGYPLPQLILEGHEEAVTLAEFSPDNKYIVTGSQDDTARVWDAQTGKEMFSIDPQGPYFVPENPSGTLLPGYYLDTGDIIAASFSPDGRWLLTVGDREIAARLWDVQTGIEVGTVGTPKGVVPFGGKPVGHERPLTSANFSNDGSLIITTSLDGTVQLWENLNPAQTASWSLNRIAILDEHTDEVTDAAFSSDSKLIVTTSLDGTARVWSVSSGEQLYVLSSPGSGIKTAEFSPDNTYIATAGYDSKARIWDVASGQEIATLDLDPVQVDAASFTPGGEQVVTTDREGYVHFWDIETKEVTAILDGHIDQVNSVEFSPDGRLVVTASKDGTARVWTRYGAQVAVLRGPDLNVNWATFSPDGKEVITTGSDRTVRVWDADIGGQLFVVETHPGEAATVPEVIAYDASNTPIFGQRSTIPTFFSASFSPDGSRIVTALYDGTARIWGASNGEELNRLIGHTGVVRSAMFSPDNSYIVTASADNTARVWDTITGEQLIVLEGHTEPVNSAEFSPDGTRVVTGGLDGTVRVWEAATGEELAVFDGHLNDLYETEDWVFLATFSPDGSRVLSVGDDGTARLWEPETNQQPGIYSDIMHEDRFRITTASFNNDGSYVITGAIDGSAYVWSVNEHTDRQLPTYGMNAASFSPDGSLIVTAGTEGTIKVWDGDSLDLVNELKGHSGSGRDVAFSPDGSLIVSASDDGTVRIWDTASGKQMAILEGHQGSVYAARFNPAGTRVITAGSDRTARIWAVGGDELLKIAEERLAILGF